MKADLARARADTLVLWYRDQPNLGTFLHDNEIAMRLHAVSSGEGWVGPHAPFGSGDLVRHTRRWVDRQRDGDFGLLIFGTRKAGGGRSFSHLRDGKARLAETELGTISQVQASEQRRRASAEERARESLKFDAQSKAFFDLNEYRKAMLCHDAATEVERYGEIQPTTRTAMEIAGLLSA